MRWRRGFLASDAGQALVAWLAAQYMRLVHWTNSWRRVNYEVVDRLQAENRRIVACFWHGRLLMMPFSRQGPRPIQVMISSHRDGRVIARTVGRFGIGVIVGSTSRQPALALRQAARLCRKGNIICITPDGPRGPRMRAASGAVMTAELAGATLLPVSYATTRRHVMQSWDRFLIPLPFGRGVFVLGDPIEVPAHMSEGEREALRLKLEDALNAVTAEADRLTGHAPVEPAPARRAAPAAGR
jgi:lysophospholipid acyltransferase (LPLAT)-like uncharacterized protein